MTQDITTIGDLREAIKTATMIRVRSPFPSSTTCLTITRSEARILALGQTPDCTGVGLGLSSSVLAVLVDGVLTIGEKLPGLRSAPS